MKRARTVEQVPQSSKGEPSPSPKRPVVLLADDDEQIRDLGRAILERAGYSVLLADDGFTAVEALQATKDVVTAVVLDYVMPRMNGDEAFLQLRRIRPGLPILFCSGQELPDPAGRMQYSRASIIRKPFRALELVDAVGRLIQASGV